MELIIGGDHQTFRLNVFVDGQKRPKTVGQPGTVPLSVSREHCSIENCPDGTFLLRNLNPRNVTFVNGVRVMQQQVTQQDRIELGGDHYWLQWDELMKIFPKPQLVMDVTHLADIWNQYYTEMNRMTVSEKRFNAMRGILPVFTMGAIALKMAGIGGDGLMMTMVYVIAIGLSLFFCVKAFIDANKLTKRREELKRWFMAYYRCPNPECNRFLGNKDFELLMEDGMCPRCKTKFVMAEY